MLPRVGLQLGTPPQKEPFLSPVTRKSLLFSSSTKTWRYLPSTFPPGGLVKRCVSDLRGGWIWPASERMVSPFSEMPEKYIQAQVASLFLECLVITSGE